MNVPKKELPLPSEGDVFGFRFEFTAGGTPIPHPGIVIGVNVKEPRFVFAVPISHTPPRKGDRAIELSPDERDALGLDPIPQWVKCEFGAIRHVFNQTTGVGDPAKIALGKTPPELLAKVKQAVKAYRIALAAQKKTG